MEATACGFDKGVICVEIESFEEQRDATPALFADCFALVALATRMSVSAPDGEMRTQRFSSPRSVSSFRSKPMAVKKGDGLVIVRDEEREDYDTIWHFDALAFVCWKFRGCHIGAFGMVYIIRAPMERPVKTRI